MNPFIILLSLFKVLLLSIFNKKYKIIIKPLLFNNHSFRFVRKMQTNLYAPFIYLKHAGYFIFKKKSDKKVTFLSEGNIGIFDGNEKNIKSRCEYLLNIDTIKPNFGITRESIFISNYSTKFVTFIILIFLFLIIVPISVFMYKKRGVLSLLLLEFAEWVALMNTLKENKCTYLYHFCAYEIDSNFIAYLNMMKNIHNHKIPSSHRLVFFYRYLLCDTLSLTSAFQKTEIKELVHNWDVTNIVEWPIQNFQNIIPYLNKTEKQNAYIYDIAFLSSGYWLREKEKHTSLNIGEKESEYNLMKYIKDYLIENSSLKLLILLHPIEKRNEERYNESIQYHKKYFEGLNIKIGNYNKNSFEYFKQINTAIASMSSTNMQRLFCGYKTLYAPLKFPKDIFKDFELENISIFESKYFAQVLEKTLKMSEEAFFKENNLKNYNYKYYMEKKIININD